MRQEPRRRPQVAAALVPPRHLCGNARSVALLPTVDEVTRGNCHFFSVFRNKRDHHQKRRGIGLWRATQELLMMRGEPTRGGMPLALRLRSLGVLRLHALVTQSCCCQGVANR